MHQIRNLIFMILVGATGCYFIYIAYLESLLAPVPQYVFELSFWTWICWAGWHLLHKISR